jgi:hypothetical protein
MLTTVETDVEVTDRPQLTFGRATPADRASRGVDQSDGVVAPDIQIRQIRYVVHRARERHRRDRSVPGDKSVFVELTDGTRDPFRLG